MAHAKIGKRKIVIITVSCLMAAVLALSLCLYFFYFKYISEDKGFGIVQIDLSQKPNGADSRFDSLYELTSVDFCDGGEDYLAHPDSIIMPDGSILTCYVKGHGRGELVCKTSADGTAYSERLTGLPESWKYSEETPTLYQLDFVNGDRKFILISANPKWPGYMSGDGFNVSVSDNDGRTWTEFEKFYGKGSSHKVNAIVAMSSLTRLKENGEFVDKWMGLFHDDTFRCYKTILTFDENGKMQWSNPEEFFKNSVKGNGKRTDQRYFAKMAQLCEIEVVRSDNGTGDTLCMLARCENHRMNSFMAFSYDEGATWTELKETSSALSGHRHKAEYLKDGRLFITFRGIERRKGKLKQNGVNKSFYVSGWIAWVGTFDDLVNWYNGDTSAEGQYRVKLAHTYLDGQTAPCDMTNETGYAGLVVLDDGTVVTASYGRFSADSPKVYIASKRINMQELDELWRLQVNC